LECPLFFFSYIDYIELRNDKIKIRVNVGIMYTEKRMIYLRKSLFINGLGSLYIEKIIYCLLHWKWCFTSL